MKNKQLFWTVLGLLLVLTACSQPAQKKVKPIQIVGSSAMQPVVEMGAHEYLKKNPGQKVTVQGGGSGTGLSQVQSGAVEIGNSDIFAENQSGIQAEKLVDHRIAVIGVAPIVNHGVGVTDLTVTQLRGIFTGQYQNWQQLGGKNIPIVVIDRAHGSGTRAIFDEAVIQDAKKMKAQEQDSNGSVQRMVADTPGAISYVSFPYLKKTFTTLKIAGVTPTVNNVTTNRWPLWGYEHMYTKQKTSPEVRALLDFMQNSAAVQTKLLPRLHYIPIQKMQVVKDENGQVTTKSSEVVNDGSD